MFIEIVQPAMACGFTNLVKVAATYTVQLRSIKRIKRPSNLLFADSRFSTLISCHSFGSWGTELNPSPARWNQYKNDRRLC
uniref:Uncharacterized protein n=1 Tax=Nelumbo nucifera TaxID=4432 RepID=A0A822ZK48_NELNU|nr:TPA_asm: hypothetical protein HUJ06_002201 [Nelumbo nucifera]